MNCNTTHYRANSSSVPGDPTLATLLASQGKLDEAIGLCRHGVSLDPQSDAGLTNLGNLLSEKNHFAEAIDCYQKAIAISPTRAETFSNLGNALANAGRHEEAVTALKQALALNPALADAHKNLGAVLKTLGRREEATEHCRRAIQLQPSAVAFYNLGACLAESTRRNEAVKCYRRAIELNPNYAEAYNNLGQLLREQGRIDDAHAHCQRAAQLKPDLFEVHGSLAVINQDRRDLDEALRCYDRALLQVPDHPQTQFNRAMLLLLRGDFERGWPEYEWRWPALQSATRRNFNQPLWDGRDLNDGVILLYAEQGVGDAIQFVRYVPLVAERGGKVILDCHPSLRTLFQSVQGISHIVAPGAILPDFAFQCPLLTLPLAFRTSIATIPARTPYLAPDPARVLAWKERLASDTKFKVGICWAGNPKYLNDRARSIDPSLFSRLGGANASFYSLQKGSPSSNSIPNLALIDHTGELHDWNDTAALVMNLDLVISVDTAVAHLAGALAKPVWTLLPFTPDWRWMLDRNDSPWYPTMRLFRQPKPLDWTYVIENISWELSQQAR